MHELKVEVIVISVTMESLSGELSMREFIIMALGIRVLHLAAICLLQVDAVNLGIKNVHLLDFALHRTHS